MTTETGNGMTAADVLEVATDALYRDRRVRWTLEADDGYRIVLTDGREFRLSVCPPSRTESR